MPVRKPAPRSPASTRAAAPTAPPPKRWRRRKEARPQEILDAALAVFAEKGFAAARLEQVAKLAGVSKGTLYLYFDSKEALFEAVVRSAIVPRLAGAEEMLQSHRGSASELLAELYRRFVTVLADDQVAAIPKLVIAEAGNFPDLARFYLREVVGRALRLIGAVLELGVSRGEFRPMNTAHATRLVIAPVLFLALWRQSLGRHDTPTLDGEAFLADALALLIDGLKRRGDAGGRKER